MARLALALLAALAAVSCQPESKPLTMWVKDSRIDVDLALDPESRRKGLMFRQILGENHGMLFVETEDRTMDFWMKNTVIPLSIAFIRKDGRITDIYEMPVEAPGTENALHTRYPSSEPVCYALEVNHGWFKLRGIKVGDQVRFSERVQTEVRAAR